MRESWPTSQHDNEYSSNKESSPTTRPAHELTLWAYPPVEEAHQAPFIENIIIRGTALVHRKTVIDPSTLDHIRAHPWRALPALYNNLITRSLRLYAHDVLR